MSICLRLCCITVLVGDKMLIYSCILSSVHDLENCLTELCSASYVNFPAFSIWHDQDSCSVSCLCWHDLPSVSVSLSLGQSFSLSFSVFYLYYDDSCPLLSICGDSFQWVLCFEYPYRSTQHPPPNDEQKPLKL